jgi:hypothetical protein
MADRTRGARSVTTLSSGFAALASSIASARATMPNGTPNVSPALPAEPKRLLEPGTFFGPGPTPAAHAPQEAGRVYDYPFAVNTSSRPRSTEGISFAELRNLADAHDLTRIAIETRKDQISRQQWTIARVDGEEADPPKELVHFFKRPDRKRPFRRWLRRVCEEILVTDALSLYLWRNRGGGLYGVRQIDGATIVPQLDAAGETPEPPETAYLQVIKGLNAVPYTSQELLYLPRNERVHKVYGCSPVEQLIVTINLALRRQTHQLNYYDETNIPAALANTPEEWSAHQIEMFQKSFDIALSGAHNQGERSKLRFVPGKTKVELLQKEPLFHEFTEEWLARLVAFAFSLPPTALVRQNNRATAEAAQDSAEDEGLAVLKLDIKEILDHVIQEPEGLNQPEWEWTWTHDDDTDAKTQADIDVAYINAKVRTSKQVALDRFGEYEEPAEEPQPAPNAPNDQPQITPENRQTPPDDETAKAAGRSLRRRY